MTVQLIDHDEFRRRVELLVLKIRQEAVQIDAIVGLARGGFHLAAYLAEALGISGRYLIGLPAYKESGEYFVGDLVSLGDFSGLTVLLVDDATVRGVLIQDAKQLILACNAKAVYTCAMVAAKVETQPDFVSEIAEIPDFYWEV